MRAFDAALHAHTAEGSPLLAVALRMPPDHPTARRFHFVLRALEQALDGRAALLGDEERCRAVWVMPDAAQDAASPVLDALKHSLREATSEADYMMQNLAVALVPNGHPFPSAATFLAHFFDGA